MLINELKKIYHHSSQEIHITLKQETQKHYAIIINKMKECIGDISNGAVETYSHYFETDGSNKLFEELINSVMDKFSSDGLTVEQTAFTTYDSGMQECTLTFSGWS